MQLSYITVQQFGKIHSKQSGVIKQIKKSRNKTIHQKTRGGKHVQAMRVLDKMKNSTKKQYSGGLNPKLRVASSRAPVVRDPAICDNGDFAFFEVVEDELMERKQSDDL